MVSEMAMEDIEALQADGVAVSPRDVVRLNALGLKVERSSMASVNWTIPRVAFVGDVSLREPTIRDEAWILDAGVAFDLSDYETELLLRALVMATPFEKLPDPSDRKAVMVSLDDLKKNRLAGVTERQLACAVSYALMGDAPETGESAPAEVEREEGRAECRLPFEVGVVFDGVAMRIGSIEEMRKLRASELQALVSYATEVKYGAGHRKGEHARRLGEYLRAVEEVKGCGRSTEEREEPGEERAEDVEPKDFVCDGAGEKDDNHDQIDRGDDIRTGCEASAI